MNETKKVSAVDFFCIGFGAIVGVGWAVSINSWMAGSGGPLPAALGYILALVMMIPVALCYCELCAMLPVTGGGMAYAFRAFGDNTAFISGWTAFGAFITIIPWEAIYVVDILSILFPVLKHGEPLYTLAGADIYIGHIIVGTVISVILYCINRKGVSASAMLQRRIGYDICHGQVQLCQLKPGLRKRWQGITQQLFRRYAVYTCLGTILYSGV